MLIVTLTKQIRPEIYFILNDWGGLQSLLFFDDNTLLMKRRLLLYRLAILAFLNLCFLMGGWASDTYTWVGGDGDWTDEAHWTNDNPNPGSVPALPPIDADVIIDLGVTVTISNDIIVESVFLDNGAHLSIPIGASLTTRKGGAPGSDGFRLNGTSGTESTLTVNGTLNINTAVDNAPNSGLYIDNYSSVYIGGSGALNIINAPEFGIQINDDLVNYGTISIINSSDAGIETNGPVNGSKIINYGTIEISNVSGGDALNLADTELSFENHGTVILSGANDKLLDGAGDFYNYGIFSGNGTVEADDFFPQPGSTISPGTSIGTLTFDSDLDLSDVTLLIEVNAANSYDRIIVQGTADVESAILTLTGTYAPVSGDVFLIVDSTTGQVNGSFGGGPFILNGVSMVFDNTSDGVLNFGSVLPVALTSFTARPTGKAVQLDWATATETNNDYFSIEHSTDGRSFSKIGRVAGAGTTQVEQRYAFVHRTPENGLNYYRLDQHDFDGAHEYSPVQTVVIDGKNTWTAWPTLAHDVIYLEWAEAPKSNTIVEVFNSAGQKAYSQPAPEGAVRVQVPVQQWAPGMYWMVVQDRGVVSSQLFVKE